MKKTKIIGLNAYIKQIEKNVAKYWVTEQTNRLIDYAKEEIKVIARDITSHGYGMDRKGNLLDSLCWVVSYDGKMKGSGFFRNQTASEDSHMHELFPEDYWKLFPVYGHALGEDFINRWGKKSKTGEWMVAFGILAPYWGFWEVGHKNVLTHNFEKFAVMAQFYDKVSKDLKPANVAFYRSRPSYTKPKLEKMRQRLSNSPYAEKKHYEKWPSINK